jgi:hypothetical protein
MFTLIGMGVGVAYGYSLFAAVFPNLFPDSFRGAFSPGRTRRRSPTSTRSSAISSSRPSGLIVRAVLGARPSNARIALLVLLRARSSRTWPSSTSAVIAAAASK